MNKKTYYLIDESFDTSEGRKWHARVEEVLNSRNLLAAITPTYWPEGDKNVWGKIVSVNACDTRKEAWETADAWNQAHRQKGLHLFYDPV